MKVPVKHLRKFIAPEIIFGNGSRHLAGEYCKKFFVKKPIIVSDPGVINAGWTHQVEESLSEQALEFVTYADITPNPKTGEVMAGAEMYIRENCDAIVAVGGGSPMDCAKAIGIVASNKGHILQYEGVDQIAEPLPPMIFVPTTAGTSADVSQFAIISNVEELVKIAIISKAIIPDIALIDPETTTTMPPYITSCTGMDALVHAIEAFVSKAGSKITDVHALEAIRLLGMNLTHVAENPDNTDIRQNIMLASMQAGLAFSNAVLGAVHAMAHSLGGFLDLPHGECNSLLLEHVISFNYDAVPEKYKIVAQTLGIDTRGLTDTDISNSLFDHIRSIRHHLGISKSLKTVNVKKADIPHLSIKAANDPCLLTNPKQTNQEDIENIYEEAL